MSPLDLIPGWVKLAILAAAVSAATAFLGYEVHHQRDIGRAEVQLKWDAAVSDQRAKALAEATANAEETARRLKAQKENQDAQDELLAAAHRDAALNAAGADRLRAQLADTAHRWREALRHSPTVVQCQAAGTAIVLQADVLGRADRRAGELAAYSDAARAAGLKCQADYDALTSAGKPSSTTTERLP
jgi:hypothetical protein